MPLANLDDDRIMNIQVIDSSSTVGTPSAIARYIYSHPSHPLSMMHHNGIRLASSTLTSARTSVPSARSVLLHLGPIPSRSIPIASHRAIHTTQRLQSGGLTNLFDADEQGARPRLAVHKLNDEGFHLSDGLVIPGGVIFVENRAFLWDVDPVGTDALSGRGKWKEEGWSKDRFKVFETVVPRPGKCRHEIPPLN
jgi:hypothetical protein